MAKSAHMSIRLDPELDAELRRLAELDRRPVSAYVALVLKDHVEAQAKAKAKK
jgi:predicted transcriptional regulator